MQHVDKTTFFKSAEELGLTDPQYEALLEVRQRMLDGRINSGNFNYGVWPTFGYDGCGCIGYHAERVIRRWGWLWRPDTAVLQEHSVHIHNLFYGGDLDMSVKEALTGLENFLTTGDPLWQLGSALCLPRLNS